MGKAYRIPSATDRSRKRQVQIKNLQAQFRNRNTPRPVATTAFAGVSAAGDTGGGTGNFLDPAGDTMIGPFALAPPVDFSVDIDSNGIIDIGESSSNSQYSSNVQFEDIQPNTFVLDTIAGAAYNGQVLILRTFAPSTPITIAQATLANGGNIQTLTDADFTMGDLQMIWLVFDADLIVFDNAPGGTWRVLTEGGGYDTIQDEGISLTQRSTMNFIGAGVTAVDNAGQNRTDITITGAATNEFPDNLFRVTGSVDPTKKLAFEVDGFTTATTRTITIPNSTTTMAGLGVTSQTWTGSNTFVGNTVIRDTNFFIQDGGDITKQMNFSLGGATTGKVVTVASDHTDNRTITFPDATTILAALSNTTLQVFSGSNDFSGLVTLRDTFLISNVSDITKQVTFDVSGITTGTIRTLTLPNSTTTLAGLGVVSQTWTGTNTYAGPTLFNGNVNIGNEDTDTLTIRGTGIGTNISGVNLVFNSDGWDVNVASGDAIVDKVGGTPEWTVDEFVLDAHTKKIQNVVDATADQDAVTLSQLNSKTAGFMRTPLNSALSPVTLTPINWTREITAVVTQV